MPVDVFDLCDRAEQNYASLSDIEKALYHIFDFHIIREMEGSVHYFVTGQVEHVPLMSAFLKKSDTESAQYLQNMLNVFYLACGRIDADDFERFYTSDEWAKYDEQFKAWADAYHDLNSQRWKRINQYLKSIGHETVE